MDLLTVFFHNAISFIVIISVIVFIHEFGHYFIAKISGVKIEVFSLGFGKELCGWNDKSGTRWRVSLFPLGGYVKMLGDSGPASTPDNEKIAALSEEDEKRAFYKKPLGIKAAIVAAGPIANFLLSILVLTWCYSVYGHYVATPQAGMIIKGSPAEAAGLLPGDRLVLINQEPINEFSDIQRLVSIHPDEALTIVIKRNDQQLTKIITPQLKETTDVFGNKIKVGMLGISSPHMELQQKTVPQSFILALHETYSVSVTTLTALGQMITGRHSTDDLGGTLRIAQYSGQATSLGMQAVLGFIALLSLNLGLLNLFPIPLLDGGHLLYYLFEALFRRPLPASYQQFGFRIGMALIASIFVLSTLNDIKKLFH